MSKKRSNTFHKIRSIVAQIPKGKVLTYGEVAKLAAIKDARVVGWALRGNQNPAIPCHRVVKANGFLARNYSLAGWQEQKRRLETEGIEFIQTNQHDIDKHHFN